jgi:multisite-specific tRNA:(cytosine-C5)-methyltransferase
VVGNDQVGRAQALHLVNKHVSALVVAIVGPTADGSKPKNRYLKFDRILADVPCSGDGTTRKNVGVGNDQVGRAQALHLVNKHVSALVVAIVGNQQAGVMELLHAGEEDAIAQVTEQIKSGTAGPEPLGPEGW